MTVQTNQEQNGSTFLTQEIPDNSVESAVASEEAAGADVESAEGDESSQDESLESTAAAADDSTAQPGESGEEEPTSGDEAEPDAEVEFPKYMDQLEGDLQKNETLAKFKNPTALARAYLELEGRLGNSVQIPGEKATEDDRQKFFAALGRPDSPEGYDFGDALESELTKEFRSQAFENGITQEQAKKINEWYTNIINEKYESAVNEFQRKTQETRTELKKKWGSDYEKNQKAAVRAMQAFASPDLVQFFNKTKIGNHPLMAEFFKTIGEHMGEDNIIVNGEHSQKKLDTLLDYKM